ncbi:hypothetical protein BBJ28_00025927, partial [Nothophytophthora sp. Chile5]
MKQGTSSAHCAYSFRFDIRNSPVWDSERVQSTLRLVRSGSHSAPCRGRSPPPLSTPAKGKTSGAKAPAKKTAAKPNSSSAKAKAKATTPSGVDAPSADAPQAAASTPEDRVPIPRKAAKPVAAVSASADAHGAAAPETPVVSPAHQDADLAFEDKTSVPTHSCHSSATASSPPPAQRKLTRTEWKAQRSGRATEPSTGSVKAARKRPAPSSPLKETDASRRTRHVPGKHDELFYQSDYSHNESYEGSPSEDSEIAQSHSSEVVSNHLDEQQEDYWTVRQSQFAEMRTPATGRHVNYPDGYYPPAPSSSADQWLATLINPRPHSSKRPSTGVWEHAL